MATSAIGVLLLSWSLGASAQADPKSEQADPKNEYSYGQLGIKKIQDVRGNLEITFNPIQEQFYWCPGIKTKDVKTKEVEGLVLIFVRCPTRKSCGVDIRAKIGRKLVRTATVNPKGQDVYIKNGEKLKKIHSVQKPGDKKSQASWGKPSQRSDQEFAG